MRCLNCGSDVPFAGNVCPRCHADKGASQQAQVLMTVAAICGGALGVLTYEVTDVFWAAVIVGFLGILPFMGKYNALRAQRPVPVVEVRGQPAPTRFVQERVVERQIVKVKCSHCGALADQWQAHCTECGARI